MIQLADHLLKPHGLSYVADDEIKEDWLDVLGLKEEQVYQVIDEVIQGNQVLTEMAMASNG